MADNDDTRPVVLLTRARAQSKRTARALAERVGDAAEVVIAPLLEIVPIGEIPALDAIAGLIFTSENGVRAFAARAAAAGRHAWCVGDRTAAVARQAGFEARSAAGSADDLVAAMLTDRPPGRWLHLCGRHVRGAVAERLRAGGVAAESVAIYDQRPVAPGPEFGAGLARHPMVPLFSPRSARIFAEAAGTAAARAQFIAMSPAVRDALPGEWRAACEVVDRPDAEAMLAALARRICP